MLRLTLLKLNEESVIEFEIVFGILLQQLQCNSFLVKFRCVIQTVTLSQFQLGLFSAILVAAIILHRCPLAHKLALLELFVIDLLRNLPWCIRCKKSFALKQIILNWFLCLLLLLRATVVIVRPL